MGVPGRAGEQDCDEEESGPHGVSLSPLEPGVARFFGEDKGVWLLAGQGGLI